MKNMELRLAGSGGQGVILASVILAEAAVQAGKYTAQSQSYGPEARGGACRAETLISNDPIGFTKVQQPTFLMTLTEAAYQKYAKNISETCLLLADESVPGAAERENAVILPILRTAKEVVGKTQCANIVAVGCINEMLHIVDRAHLEEAVRMHVPAGTEEINLTALAEGEKLYAAYARQNRKTENYTAEHIEEQTEGKTVVPDSAEEKTLLPLYVENKKQLPAHTDGRKHFVSHAEGRKQFSSHETAETKAKVLS